MPQTQTKPEKLFAEFAKPTYEQWRAAAEATLKGAPFDKKLLTQTIEGITLQPIYNASDVKAAEALPAQASTSRGAQASGYLPEGWAVAQELPYGEPQAFNRALSEDLGRGQTALNVILDIATQKGIDPDSASVGEVGACGLSLSSVADLQEAFKGVVFSAVPIYWQTGMAGIPVLALFAAYLNKAKVSTKDVRGSFDMDPLGSYLKAGELPVSVERSFDELAAATLWTERNTPAMATLGVQGNVYSEAGANAVQELAYTLSATTEYLRALDSRNVSPKTLLSRTRWLFAVGPHFFTEVSKFRAARILWANLLRAYGLDVTQIPARLHARTGLYHKTVYDPHNNLLRSSMEAFSAIVGGIESLHVGPFDEVAREPDSFSRRLARNTQVILREECNLDKIIDPAGGSYYVESLTQELAAKAWEKFQCIEKAGGFLKAIQSGELQKMVAATAAERQKRLSQRRDVLVGTNLYAVAKEVPQKGISTDYEAILENRKRAVLSAREASDSAKDVAILQKLETLLNSGKAPTAALIENAVAAASAGATLGEIARTLRAGSSPSDKIAALPYRRLAMDYEQLRALAKACHPKVFLATMGPLREHKARADFIQAFLEAGGIDVIYPTGFKTSAEAAEAFQKSGAKLAVICSTDELYPTLVPEVAKALKVATPSSLVYLAGAPAPEQEANYRAAGMDDYIFIKSNHLETLRKIVNLYNPAKN